MTLEDWFESLSDREQNVLLWLGFLAALLSVSFAWYYYTHLVVTYTCYDWTGAVVTCPVGYP